ncbi:MAG: hypothetical protein Q4D77_04955 [Peptostreptococcaceae bacterium]|nr:hypothetical protein [Peptostreptococcaceae bacterium]
MKKYYRLIAWMTGILLFLAGCAKDNAGSGGGGTTTPIEPVDPKITKLLESSLKDAEEACRVIWFGDLQIDKTQVHKVKSQYTEDGVIEYYRVTDPKYQTLADLEDLARKVFSERIYYTQYQPDIHTEGGMFIEVDGKLYYSGSSEGMDVDSQILHWDMSDIQIGYEASDRKVYYIPLKVVGDQPRRYGKVALVNEKDVWKLDTNTPIDAGPINEDNDTFESEQQVLYYIDQQKAWRLPRKMSDYMAEIDHFYWSYRDHSLQTNIYLGVNFYSIDEKGKLKLEDKLFVPYHGGEILVPEKDDKGVINLSYSYAGVEGKDALFGYLAINSKDFAEEVEKRVNFRESKLQSFPYQFGGDSNGSFWIIPKYYGTTLLVGESGKPDGLKEWVQDDVLMLSKGDSYDQLQLRSQGEQINIKAAFNENATFPKGAKISFNYPEAVG